MNTYAIDFETEYSKTLSIPIQGVYRYIREADIYMVSIVGPDIEWVGHPQECPHWDALVGAHLIAHNMSFDGAILNHLMERGQIPQGVGSGAWIAPRTWPSTSRDRGTSPERANNSSGITTRSISRCAHT